MSSPWAATEEELLARKREAVRASRARQKAATKEKEAQAQRIAALIAAEKERQQELLQDQAALAGMAAYQADALQVLSLGALGERVEGEVTLVGEHAWQQLKVLQALQPEPEAGRASSSAQSSAELASSASADSRYPAAQHDRHSMFWLSDTIWFSYVNEAPAWMMNLVVLGMRLLPKRALEQRNRAFLDKLEYTLQQWEAFPAKRPFFEKIIKARFYDRQYLMRAMARYRPQLLLELWSEQLLPPPAECTAAGGKPPLHDILLPIARYLEANLSAKQVQALEADWQRYQQQTAAARKLGVDSVLQLQYNAAVYSMSWQRQAGVAGGGSTAERSQAFGSITTDASNLRRFCEEEGIALLDLQQSLLRVLSPIQAARVTLAATPYLPDMRSISNYLFTGPRIFASEKGGVAVAEVPLPTASTAASAAASADAASPGVGLTELGAPLDQGLQPADDALLDLLAEEGGESLLADIDFLLDGDVGAGISDPGHLFWGTPRPLGRPRPGE